MRHEGESRRKDILRVQLAGGQNVRQKFYAAGEGFPYFMYFDTKSLPFACGRHYRSLTVAALQRSIRN